MIDYIFLSGVHGSGKSTLSEKINEKINIDYVSVSDLIRRAGKSISSHNKSTTDININQNLWKNELNKIESKQKIFLLDGHFCLLNRNNELEILPENIFDGTSMTKIILVTNTAETICSRLQVRDNKNYPVSLIQKFIETEEKQAHRLSQINEIPLFVYNDKEPFDELLNFLTET